MIYPRQHGKYISMHRDLEPNISVPNVKMRIYRTKSWQSKTWPGLGSPKPGSCLVALSLSVL